MNFIADQQTLDDLNLLGKYKPNSIFSIFNQVITGGGEKLLAHMFRNPMTDPVQINERSSTIAYFQAQQISFPFSKEQLIIMEDYFHEASQMGLLATGFNVLKKQLLAISVKDQQYEQLHLGIISTVQVLKELRNFLNQLEPAETALTYLSSIKSLEDILSNKRVKELLVQIGSVKTIGLTQIVQYDHLLRNVLQKEMKAVLGIIHYLDVYLAVAGVAQRQSFSYAQALPNDNLELHVEQMRHPSIENAVGNLTTMHQHSNMIFLTGANMAGKSTFMKALGIAVYLAHMGFPVATANMRFSVKDGIYSSINVPDNLNLGLSHFYAEVLRVKKVAEEVSSGKKLLVIFDELFKGTNVKDAHDATYSITEAFSRYKNCFFIISTHIIEVAEAFKRENHIQFQYLPTIMDGLVPMYTYQLTQGVTADRQGMMIIENEGILKLITGINSI
ncbi:MutS-related protein [Pedobacter antarcticus]|uniref:MutS-related protein n=1 Tax=Pedobacter antarcticus TaxID=34086 RepID=UPI00292FF81B|nr:DNA mismatch repair protein [Pedobacter antarcticus]